MLIWGKVASVGEGRESGDWRYLDLTELPSQDQVWPADALSAALPVLEKLKDACML